jgi:amino acid transporter
LARHLSGIRALPSTAQESAMNANPAAGKRHLLKPVLGTLQLWGIAVGLVISGEYFGWSYGWASAGTLGFTITSIFIAAMYATFIFSFTELTTSIPHAGGPFAYSKRAFGPTGGYLAGAATRQIFALAREAYLPSYFAGVHPRFKTPHRAILAGGMIGIAAIFSDELIKIGGQTLTANIVTMAVFGAILMYILSMLSLFRLRHLEPDMVRPFRAPFYPYFPAFALFGAVVCLGTMIFYNPLIFAIFVLFLLLGYGYFRLTGQQRADAIALSGEH